MVFEKVLRSVYGEKKGMGYVSPNRNNNNSETFLNPSSLIQKFIYLFIYLWLIENANKVPVKIERGYIKNLSLSPLLKPQPPPPPSPEELLILTEDIHNDS